MDAQSGSDENGRDAGGDNPGQRESFSDDPEFYRRVLHYLPTPVAVVDDQGKIIYFNQSLLALGGWEVEPDSDLGFLSFVHPDDQDELANAFSEIVQSPGARILGSRHWAEISFRLIAADGTTLPVEIVGIGGLLDTAVGGIIYEVRTAQRSDLLRRVLDGLSSGATMLQLLSLVGEMIAAPPLDLEAVILQSSPHGGLVLAASTSTELAAVLQGNHIGAPWEQLAGDPTRVDLASLEPGVRERFEQSSFHDLWYASVESQLTANTLRIVAASPTHHVPANGPRRRLKRAQEIAAAVLLRTQADVLLAHAADHDSLTDLPNRAAFYQLAESLDPMLERGALHLDLDGLKPVNDTYGSFCGDAVLRIVADRLRAAGSTADIIGRIGDDEFAILLTRDGTAEPMMDRAVKLASAVLEAVSDPIVVAGRPLHISTSIGVAAVPANVSTDHLMTWADAAMHDAKAAGGGRISRFGVAFG